MIIAEMILMGVFATFIMDLFTGFLLKRRLIQSFISPEVVGRWFLYMFRGKFYHRNIRVTPALKNEKRWSFIAHYLIGIVLAGGYLILELKEPSIRELWWMPLAFGIATVILPWFWLFPSMGFGFIASKSNDRSGIIRTSLVNHTNFGLGLFIWVISIHPVLSML